MNRIKRPIAATVLFTFLSMVLQPLSVFAQDRPQSAASRRAAESGEQKFSRTLNEIHELLKEVAPHAAMPHMFPRQPGEMQLRAIGPNMKIEGEVAKPVARVDVAAKVSQLRAKAKELASLEEHVRAGFDDTARHIKEKSLPAEILARHEEALNVYEARAAEFKVLMGAVERASGDQLQSALGDLAAFMAKYPNQKTHTPTDPNNLPWGSPKPVTREPYTRPSQFSTSRLFGEPVKVAQAGSLSGISLPSTTLPATPVPADTAPTEDVQITQPIRDLAASLNNNPVQIYNWVRNNIQFIPSYGSIQGSDMTLQTKRGNAFDTASLLIALLRAANVPSRYVYGTVEVPASQAMNWVGGVNEPRAAINLMGQGGIPTVGVSQSGQVRAVRLEHVWVEAFVDYVPSRGAVNRSPNTWVPLDASFKQYQFTQGMHLEDDFPFDVQTFHDQVRAGATINDAEGWAQNANPSVANAFGTDFRNRLLQHIEGQKPNATVGDVLGTQTIVQDNRSILAGTLPYARIATGGRFQSIPDNLRWKFRYQLYATSTDRALDSPFVSYVRGTASLAGRKITLSFEPATAADRNTLISLLPTRGSPLQLSELPQSLPAYLLRLVPELRTDGELVATGPAFTAGAELIQRASYFNPSTGQWEQGEDNRPLVGEYIATSLDLQGISPSQARVMSARLTAVKARLEAFDQNRSDPTPLQGLSKEDFTGDLLYGVILNYFASIDTAAQLAARISGTVTHRMPSYGNFGTTASPQFFFGVPRSVRFPGLTMDVDRILGIEVSKDGTPATLVAFRKAVGLVFSAHEHLIPEQALGAASPQTSIGGVSAVRAIGIAMSQGQRVYTLNAQNQSSHGSILAQLSVDASVKQEIAAALAVGREAIVHQSDVHFRGFSGAGYIITDPETGAGAYKISGGASGAMIALLIALLLVIAGFLLDIIVVVVAVSLIFGLITIAINTFLAWYFDLTDQQQILIALAEIALAFIILKIALIVAGLALAPALIVTAALIAFYLAFVGLLWEIFGPDLF